MLYETEVVEAVAEALSRRPQIKTVVDPVMASSSGETLLMRGAAEALVMKLFPKAYMVTPNTAEASALTGITITDTDSMTDAAKKIAALGPRSVLVKGGHILGDDITDVLYVSGEIFKFRKQRVDTPHTHGTGCALSAAITAELAKGADVVTAVETAERFMEKALLGAFPIGKGPGALDHMAWIRERR
jgi:hydroxymethylpyrimidine/phosphomethylpyrimidine kinase